MGASPWRAALGRQIRDARVARGWSWAAVDRRSGVSVRTWQRVENGHAAGDHALIGIAETLGWDKGECFRILADALDKEAAG